MTKKIKEEDVINGYKVGNLKIVIQGVPDAQIPNRIVKGVFCTLNVAKEDENGKEKKESINFTFALNSVPDFRKHILSMINQAIELKTKSLKKDGKK
jgi:hypothetical protein